MKASSAKNAHGQTARVPAGLVEMRRATFEFAVTMAVSTVATLGIADHLAQGPKTGGELAQLTGANEAFLNRVLRFLVSEGIFRKESDTFALNERSHWLQSGIDGSVRSRAVFAGSELSWNAWGRFASAVRTGRSGVEIAFGEPLFAHLKSDREDAAIFNQYMADQTAASVEALLSAYSFEGVEQLVDVGGGRGALLAGILRAYPEIRGILFDAPEVVAGASPILNQAGVSERCSLVGGDFFETVPAGADCYVLKYILHDWPDADCVRILSNCREAMVAGGKIVVVENILPKDNEPSFATFMDMNMLVMTDGGRERTQVEFGALLTAAGLRLRDVMPTRASIYVLESEAV